MPYADRQTLLRNLEQKRGSRVLVYFLGDRESMPPLPGMTTALAPEPQMLIVDLLDGLEKADQLDLYLYTRGGQVESVWPLVNNLRQRCKRLCVLVPFRAHSAGTLCALGADEIVMTDWAELSPIDPTTANDFNPSRPDGSPVGISVEDVTAYFSLAKEMAGMESQAERLEVFKQLTATVNPLALGNVQRVYMMIRRLARELLALHENPPDKVKVEQIVEALTTQFYAHVHSISRREALQLMGDWVTAAQEPEEKAMMDLLREYGKALKLTERFSLAEYMGEETSQTLHSEGAFLETAERSFVFTVDLRILQRPKLPQGVQVQVPPGQPIPLWPWVEREFDVGAVRTGWVANSEEV